MPNITNTPPTIAQLLITNLEKGFFSFVIIIVTGLNSKVMDVDRKYGGSAFLLFYVNE